MPADLTKSLAIFDALRWVEVGHAVEFDLADITAANAEEKVVEFAGRLVPALPGTGNLGRTPLEEAKQQMLSEAARVVVGQAAAAVPAIIEQLTPEFSEHAAAYVAAVDLLPEALNSDALVKAGATAVQAYATAQHEAAYLDKVSSWVAGTRDLPGFAGLDAEPVLRVLRPSGPDQLAKLDAAHHTYNVDQTLQAVNEVFFAAAREGIEFGINTLREAAEIRASQAITVQSL
ncbi:MULTISPECIES: hypothetical protein [unclassified Mycolicibacterium]|uniref:hypothetical protein n=1 Tax=unclassified Mycolicibacterium TaxID=2636767 RepID=UPI001EE3A9C2|nr:MULTISPECIES: hypothetical protein [unclassified Mycolicibacterium]